MGAHRSVDKTKNKYQESFRSFGGDLRWGGKARRRVFVFTKDDVTRGEGW
jgi:hypothetical protein